MTYQQPARGKYGHLQPNIHDLTGRKFRAALEHKEDRTKAIQVTINELNSGGPVVFVPVPGSGTFAIPKDAYDRAIEIWEGK